MLLNSSRYSPHGLPPRIRQKGKGMGSVPSGHSVMLYSNADGRPRLRDQKRLPVRLFDPVISHLISIVLCDADRSSSVAAGGRSASAENDIQ